MVAVSCVYAPLAKPCVVMAWPVLGRGRLQVRAQCFREEQGESFCDGGGAGRLGKMVDANMGVLRERMEEVKMRERVERCLSYRQHEYGWNYAPSYDYKLKKDKQLAEFVQLLFLISGSLGFTFLSGTFSLCLLSFLLHFHH
ncbi:hypothetical protein SDJN02_21659, partial [Cucurbita argyrosperma subsp. argyrosperma]